MIRVRSIGFLVLFAIAAALPAQAPKTDPLPKSDLVLTQEGQLPIIISAPHGGLKAVPDVPARKGEGLPTTKGSGYTTARDTGTEELAQDIAKAVEAKLGKKPYLVVARFSRKYIDVNRPPEIAYESKAAKPTYDVYHGTLSQYCKDVQKAYGRGLLLDVHGQGTAKDTIFRGTKDGKSVTLLRERFGEKAHNGPESFFGLLAANGATIYPDMVKEVKDKAGLSGGYITQTYGSHTGYGIDAIQLEFGSDYRTADKRKAAAEKVAATVEGYSKRYLTTK